MPRPTTRLSGCPIYLATHASTDGDFGLYRVDLAPAAGGPGPHFHKTISESFFVLSAAMRLFDGRGSATKPTSPHPCCCCSRREFFVRHDNYCSSN